MTRRSILLLALFLLASQSCSPPVADSSPRNPVVEADIVGTWQLDYEGTQTRGGWLSGIETIVLKANGSYIQYFDNGKEGRSPVSSNTWILTRNYDDKQAVKLESMHYFPDGIDQAIKNPPKDSIFLIVQTTSSLPFGLGRKELVLCFEDADLFRCFSRVADEPSNVRAY